MEGSEDSGQNGGQVIARVASVLEALARHPAGMSLGQIAKATGLPRSTVQRLVRGLEGEGLAIVGDMGVRLGPTITRLAACSHVDLVSVGTPFIEAGSRRVRETIDLSVLRGAHALSVYQYPSDRELRVVSPVGAAFPLHCTAHGKALLAEMSETDLRALLRAPFDRRTINTTTDIEGLLAELEQVRADGFAVDREEHELGVCGIGVAIQAGTGDRYALSVAVPSLRFDGSFDALKTTIMRCRAEIEGALA